MDALAVPRTPADVDAPLLPAAGGALAGVPARGVEVPRGAPGTLPSRAGAGVGHGGAELAARGRGSGVGECRWTVGRPLRRPDSLRVLRGTAKTVPTYAGKGTYQGYSRHASCTRERPDTPVPLAQGLTKTENCSRGEETRPKAAFHYAFTLVEQSRTRPARARAEELGARVPGADGGVV